MPTSQSLQLQNHVGREAEEGEFWIPTELFRSFASSPIAEVVGEGNAYPRGRM